MIKKRSTLMKRRKIAIIIAAIAVVALGVAYFFVHDFVKTEPVTDDADGTVYYIKYRDKAYALYDTDKKTILPTDGQYGYYITHAGSLIEVDAETGEYEKIAVVDTVESEVEGFNSRLLMFPHIEKKNIRQLDVHNSNGSFTFVRYNIEKDKVDNSSDFIIKGSPLTAYDQEMFASLYVSAGYTLTTLKIKDPIKDENGEFSEYGLVPCKRVREVVDEKTGEYVIDEETGKPVTEEYDYVPAYYVLTDTNGNKYKVIIGDMLVTGGGYYVQYVDMSSGSEVKRDAVYVLSADFGTTMLASVEEFVTPALTYPMTMNTYFDVENFFILNKNHEATEEKDAYEAIVGFSYIDLSERENTIKASEPYVFLGGTIDGYTPSSDNINLCLQSIYTPSFNKVCKLSPSGKDLVKYGLAKEDGTDDKGNPKYVLEAEHMIRFNYDALDDDGKVVGTFGHVVYITDTNADGNRYAYTEIYSVDKEGDLDELLYSLDMVVEVQGHSLAFLDWDPYEWINSSYINLNIAFCDKITLNAKDYWAEFTLDNSESDSTESISSTNLSVGAKDSAGHDKTTFSSLSVLDVNGNTWVITATEIKCYNSAGTEYKTITDAYYDYNVMKTQVRVLANPIQGADGSKVYVTADEVRVDAIDNAKDVSYVRYDTNLFRQFYKTLLYASIANSYSLTDEERDAIKNDESRLMLKMTVTNSEGKTTEYCFYSLTSRKAYITINGNGGFYVLTNRVNKFISDAQRFFANEMIDATAKN